MFARPAVLAVLVPLALLLPADELRFAPKSGTELAKKLAVELEFTVDEISVEMNGQPLPPEALGEVQDATVLLGLALDVTEKFVEVKDGQPTELLRTYETVDFKAEAGDESTEKSNDKLAGKTVRFLWDEKSGEYAKSFHECTGEETTLEPLSADMDLRVMLPPKSVKEGDKWTVPGEKALSILLPGMQSAEIDFDEMDADGRKALEIVLEEVGGQFEEALKKTKLACEYRGQKEVEGAKLGDVGFLIEGEVKLDLANLIKRLSEEMDENSPDIDATANVTLTLKGEGTLLWNTATGVLSSFELNADTQLRADVQATADVQGQQMKMSLRSSVGGKGSWKLTTSKP